YVADMRTCYVLPAHVAELLVPLRDLIGSLSIPDRIPQIEVAVGDAVTAFVLRHLEPLTDDDLAQLEAFASRHAIQWWLQPKGPDSIHPLNESSQLELSYALPEWGLRMPFLPTDFTQVNHAVNRVMVSRAVALLDPQPGERVADMFCGLGNFTLPLAKRGAEVLGVEGSEALTSRAMEAAERHDVAEQTRFIC